MRAQGWGDGSGFLPGMGVVVVVRPVEPLKEQKRPSFLSSLLLFVGEERRLLLVGALEGNVQELLRNRDGGMGEQTP